MTVTIPMRLPSVANLREHWAVKAKRSAAQRGAARLACNGVRPAFPVTIKLVRVSPRPLDDDNLRSAFKAIRDGVTDAVGLKDDRDPRLSWEYEQRRGRPKEHAVLVEFLAHPLT